MDDLIHRRTELLVHTLKAEQKDSKIIKYDYRLINI